MEPSGAIGQGVDLFDGGRAGEGSVFRVLLPLASADSASAPAIDGTDSLGIERAAGPLREQVQLLDVLVIDDEELVTNLVQELLRTRLAWQVEPVHDGHQGIQRLEQGPFDLVITDLHMPGLDGFAVLGWIREFRPALLPKVLVITGDSGSQSMDLELLSMGIPVLPKPFTPDELIEACQKVLAVV